MSVCRSGGGFKFPCAVLTSPPQFREYKFNFRRIFWLDFTCCVHALFQQFGFNSKAFRRLRRSLLWVSKEPVWVLLMLHHCCATFHHILVLQVWNQIHVRQRYPCSVKSSILLLLSVMFQSAGKISSDLLIVGQCVDPQTSCVNCVSHLLQSALCKKPTPTRLKKSLTCL